jgi:hypothetical protein
MEPCIREGKGHSIDASGTCVDCGRFLAITRANLPGRLTSNELEMIGRIGDWLHEFCQDPLANSTDIKHAVQHVHALQTMVMARAAKRAHPEIR